MRDRIFEMLHIPIPNEWLEYLRQQDETGMDYQVVRIALHDGRKLEMGLSQRPLGQRRRKCSET